ncbi:MAG: helix-turn-helix transcriptional regulator [Burkholderiales bacterium]|nr:helix-turn-helix transcriptional regulator [Burkholderiales bacterium]
MSLGARLAQLRLRKGESLQTVADAVGISKTHVWQLEKGNSENPSIELLKKLADHYAVPLTYLVGDQGDATLEDVEAQQFFRDFKSLSEAEQAVLKQTLEVFKSKKVPGDASA